MFFGEWMQVIFFVGIDFYFVGGKIYSLEIWLAWFMIQ